MRFFLGMFLILCEEARQTGVEYVVVPDHALYKARCLACKQGPGNRALL